MKSNLLALIFLFLSANSFSSSNNNQELGSIFIKDELNDVKKPFYLPLTNNSYQLINSTDKDFTTTILVDDKNRIISIENSGYNSTIFSNIEECKSFFLNVDTYKHIQTIDLSPKLSITFLNNNVDDYYSVYKKEITDIKTPSEDLPVTIKTCFSQKNKVFYKELKTLNLKKNFLLNQLNNENKTLKNIDLISLQNHNIYKLFSEITNYQFNNLVSIDNIAPNITKYINKNKLIENHIFIKNNKIISSSLIEDINKEDCVKKTIHYFYKINGNPKQTNLLINNDDYHISYQYEIKEKEKEKNINFKISCLLKNKKYQFISEIISIDDFN